MKYFTRRQALMLISGGLSGGLVKALLADTQGSSTGLATLDTSEPLAGVPESTAANALDKSGKRLPNARVSDKNLPATDTPQPDYLESYHDEHFDSRVTRITPTVEAAGIDADSQWYPHSRHIYSKVAAWDASDRWLAVRTWSFDEQNPDGFSRWLLLDGQTYKVKNALSEEFIEFRWLNRSAGRCLMLAREAMVEYSPANGVIRRYQHFDKLLASYSDLSLAGESNLSDDDKRIALIGTHRKNNVRTVLFYDLEADALHFAMPMDIPRLDFATVSPSGQYVLVNGEFTAEELDRTEVFYWGEKGQGKRAGERAGKRWEPYGYPSHYDLTLDENGHDIAVGVAKETVGEVRAGSVVARRLDTGKIKQLLTGGYAMHTSCRNLANRRWCFVSYVGRFPEDYPPFADELVAVAVDGSGDYQRICQFQQEPGGYWTQCQACPSTDGKQAVFASNWRDADNPVQAYVVQTGL